MLLTRLMTSGMGISFYPLYLKELKFKYYMQESWDLFHIPGDTITHAPQPN